MLFGLFVFFFVLLLFPWCCLHGQIWDCIWVPLLSFVAIQCDGSACFHNSIMARINLCYDLAKAAKASDGKKKATRCRGTQSHTGPQAFGATRYTKRGNKAPQHSKHKGKATKPSPGATDTWRERPVPRNWTKQPNRDVRGGRGGFHVVHQRTNTQ